MQNTSTQVFTATLPASGRLRIQDGNVFELISAGAVVDVDFYRAGTSFGAKSVTTGFAKGVLVANRWEQAYITGTPGSQVKYAVGYDEIDSEYTRFSSTTASVLEVLPQTIADQADVDVGGSAVAVIVAPANPARKRVTIKVRDDATVSGRIGTSTVTATRGVQLGNGQSQDFEGPAAVYMIREAVGTLFTTMNELVN